MKTAYIILGGVLAITLYFAWKLTSRDAYESAIYTVIRKQGAFEIREYPELLMATTSTQFESQGGDGSFMRLFGYISGANADGQKVAMTTPVFMERESGGDPGQMGFVVPTEVAQAGAPQPSDSSVDLRDRRGGRFAVIRFSGRLSPASYNNAERQLRKWMSAEGLTAEGTTEAAGYDAPWTPGPFRRNELLIRFE